MLMQELIIKCTVGKVFLDNNEFYLCQTATSTPGEMLKITEETDEFTYNTFTVTSTNFAGATLNKEINVKIVKESSAILLVDASLPTCKDVNSSVCKNSVDNSEVSHCIHNNKICTNDSNSKCNPITSITEGEIANFYFDDDDKYSAVETITATSKIAMVYQCQFGTEANNGTYDVESCSLVKGYLLANGKIVHCNGWINDGCSVTPVNSPTTCSLLEEGSAEGTIETDGTKICFATAGIDLNEDHYAFAASKTNPNYGVAKDEKVFLTITSKQAIITKPVPGFFKTPTTNFMKCIDNDISHCIIGAGDANCASASNTGKITSGGELCLADSDNANKATFGTGHFIIEADTSNSVFGDTIDNTDVGLLKATAHSLTLDKNNSKFTFIKFLKKIIIIIKTGLFLFYC